MHGRLFLALWLVSSGAAGCSGDKTKPERSKGPAIAAALPERIDVVPADLPGVGEHVRAHLNLQSLVHLADVDQGGLFIDFGTPARAKYTVGRWKTGWGKDGTEGDTTFTHCASNTGRVYLPLPGDGALTLRFRLQPLGTGTMQLYLNNHALPVVRLDKGAGFADYDVAVPAGVARAGENHLLLRFGDTRRIGDEEVSVAMDSLRVLSAPAEANQAAPRYEGLVKDVSVGGSRQRAIALSLPTRLQYHLEVPKEAQLSLRVAATGDKPATATVSIAAEGEAPVTLLDRALTPRFTDQVIPLGKWAGKVVRLELANAGQGGVAWSSPSILVPARELSEVKAPAKNVVVVLIDTMRADHLRAWNERTRVQTPVLDAIAAQSTVFEAAQSPENWTKPSVASVLTGLYPMSHGAKQSESKLSDKALLVGEVLGQSGFATASFLANGYVSDKFGFKQGWDHYVNYIRENKSTLAEHVFGDAATWIEAHKQQRFFVYIQTIDPHVPYDPPKEFLQLYRADAYTGGVRPRSTAGQLEKAKATPPKITFTADDKQYLIDLYDGEVSYHDKWLGVFVERLKKLGIWDQTLFVVTSDHGEEFDDHGSYGHGHTVYQELIHVPLLARWPGVIPAGQRIAETVGTVDVSPTVLSAVGVPVPEVMEGVDRMPHMRGAAPAGPAVAFSDFLDDRRVIRAGRYKLILRGLNATLFDLQADPGERNELDPKQHPIAMRYCRILLGQFLGTRDRGDWLAAAPAGKSVELRGEAAVIDEATRAGLKALGYAN